MKILHIIPRIGNGGAELFLIDLVKHQSLSGHDVSICSFRDLTDQTYLKNMGNASFFSFAKKDGLSVTLFFRIFSFLKKEKPDVVNCHLPSVFLYVLLPLFFIKKIKFFYTIHNEPAIEEPRAIIRTLRRFFILKKRLVPIAISDTIAQQFSDVYNLPLIDVIYNGREPIEKTSAYENVKKEVELYKQDAKTKVFIAVGRISAQKNHELLVRVFLELEKKNKNVILLIIGHDYGIGLLEKCMQFKSKNTYFLGSKNNVSDYLMCSDVFCMSSLYEGLPISIIEALCAGLPIITTNVGGIADIVKNQKNGFLVTTHHIQDYVEAIENYLNLTPENELNIRNYNQECFFRQFDIHHTAHEYLQMYTKYINK